MTSSSQLAFTQVSIDRLRLTADGRLIDFLDPETSRPNTAEERVRQSYASRLHHEYGYPKELMVFGAPIHIGSEARYADIVIYRDAVAAQRREQSKIKLVIETKAPDVKAGHDQLISYVFAGSAEGGVWINETDAPKYYRRIDVPQQRLEDWPNIPTEGEAWDGIGKHTKRKLRPPHDLVETFKRCHNTLYSVGIDSEDLAMDMVRIILAKYRDEMSEGDAVQFRVTPLEIQSAEGRKRVADRVRKLFKQVRNENLDVFEEHEAITAGDREVATVVSELQDFRFLPDADSDDTYDVVGAAYEVYVGAHLKGDRGQYFTHRLIVQLLVRLVDPGADDVIFDPAMGSAGFLVAAMRHVTRKILASHRGSSARRQALANLHRHMFGIDKSPKLVKVAKTNMILASDGHSGLVHGDSLESPSSLPQEFLRKAKPGNPTIILTNPPFGATSEHRITAERDPEILEQFQLGRIWRTDSDGVLLPTETFTSEGVPPEYLFVERCIQWVAPGGRIGIVVPRGMLDNDKALPLRTLVMGETRVLAVINCHDFTFKPHTNAKASLLVLERRKPGERDTDYPMFMAISQAIGHNGVGEPIYKTDAKGDVILVRGRPVVDHDGDEILHAWDALRAGQKSSSEYYFKIARRQITSNLNLNPVRYLPKYAASRSRMLQLGEQDGWAVERLGEIAQVFNGPRFKRPYADKGVISGSGILRYFTGNAVTQTRGENIKYLDLAKAKPAQLKMIEKLYLRRGMILITDTGTVGRVVYATTYHDGAVGTNNLIRVVVDDPALRGYVYQFLCSKFGQDQLRANIYGAILEHIEPDHVKSVIVPIPKDLTVLEEIGLPVIRGMELREESFLAMEESSISLEEALAADAIDSAIARTRLREIKTKHARLVEGDELKAMLDALIN